jgi:cysteine synthase/CBS domain-containing protein
MIQIENAPAFKRLNCKFHMKCAYMSPTGSIKDHVAQALIENALRKRSIRLDSSLTMIVPSSEALSVSAAHIGLQKGFKVTAVLPTQCRGSQRIKVLEQLGGNATFFHESDVHWETKKLARTLPNSFILDEYLDVQIVSSFYSKMADEVLNGLKSCPLHMIVCTVESAGLARNISDRCEEDCYVVGAQLPAIDPISSSRTRMLTRELNYFYAVISDMEEVLYDEAIKMVQHIERYEGMTLSRSSGAVLAAALRAVGQVELANRDNVNILLLLDENHQLQNTDSSFLSEPVKLKKRLSGSGSKWWHLLNMSRIEFDPPELISNSFTVSFAIEMMVKDGTERMVVMSREQVPTGIISLRDLQRRVKDGSLLHSALLNTDGIAELNFLKLPLCTPFGQVVDKIAAAPSISSGSLCIVLTHRQLFFDCYSLSPQELRCQEVVVGTITAEKIRAYSAFFGTKYPVNKNVDPLSGVPLWTGVWKLEG